MEIFALVYNWTKPGQLLAAVADFMLRKSERECCLRFIYACKTLSSSFLKIPSTYSHANILVLCTQLVRSDYFQS